MYPSLDLKSSVRALSVGNPLVFKKQVWGKRDPAGFQKLPKWQQIAQSGHTAHKLPDFLVSIQTVQKFWQWKAFENSDWIMLKVKASLVVSAVSVDQ